MTEAGTSDVDTLPTILNSITFNVTNTSMIRSAALFNGNALVSNVATINTGSNTIAFSELLPQRMRIRRPTPKMSLPLIMAVMD
ncbi:hypothetical protein [Flavobacterium sp. 3HN19-14]|uniref:hypothetical protein n=1 Tax=Flavobacterium sp. 3HN19-14 TaxID=3448133 RepID=UPI003EE1805F